MPPKKPSMRQIAAKADVSVVAVSYALRGTPGVSDETRQRILAVAESLGYRPDPMLSHLMHHLRARNTPKSAHNIAMLYWPRDTYRELVLHGARAQAEKHGYSIDVIEMNKPAITPRVLERMLVARGIAGMILGPSPVSDFSDLVNWDNYAIVSTSYSVINPRFHRVVPNQFSATQLAVQALHKQGYQRIGLIVPPWVEERVNYYHSAAVTWEASRSKTKPLICYHDPELQSLTHLQKWHRAHRPDALVLCYPLDYKAVVCKALGSSVVSRLGVVTLGYETQLPNTTTVDYQPALLGSMAVDQLISQLHRQERGVPRVQQTLSVEGSWLDAPPL